MASDLQISSIKKQAIHNVKYFRNNYFTAAKYKKGGQKLVLSQVVSCNTQFSCLSTCIKILVNADENM